MTSLSLKDPEDQKDKILYNIKFFEFEYFLIEYFKKRNGTET